MIRSRTHRIIIGALPALLFIGLFFLLFLPTPQKTFAAQAGAPDAEGLKRSMNTTLQEIKALIKDWEQSVREKGTTPPPDLSAKKRNLERLVQAYLSNCAPAVSVENPLKALIKQHAAAEKADLKQLKNVLKNVDMLSGLYFELYKKHLKKHQQIVFNAANKLLIDMLTLPPVLSRNLWVIAPVVIIQVVESLQKRTFVPLGALPVGRKTMALMSEELRRMHDSLMKILRTPPPDRDTFIKLIGKARYQSKACWEKAMELQKNLRIVRSEVVLRNGYIMDFIQTTSKEIDRILSGKAHLAQLLLSPAIIELPGIGSATAVKIIKKYDTGLELPAQYNNLSVDHDIPQLITLSSAGDTVSAKAIKKGEGEVRFSITEDGKRAVGRVSVNVKGKQATVSHGTLNLSRSYFSLGAGQTAPLRVIYDDGTRQYDVTNDPNTSWNNTDPTIATFSQGRVQAGGKQGSCGLFFEYKTATGPPVKDSCWIDVGGGTNSNSSSNAVSLNPHLPQIGINVKKLDPRSFFFTKNIQGENPANTYTFQWFIDGKPYAKGDFCRYKFTTPGRHYVQLVMTSTDPRENDAIIRNIGIEYPPDPKISIQVSPEMPKYAPGTPVTLTCRTKNLPDTDAYNWYIDGRPIGRGKSISHTLGGKGRYTVRVGVQRGSNYDEIKVERVIEVGPPAIKPLGRWRNQFHPAGSATNLKVCSSRWIPGFAYSNGLLSVVSQKARWSKCETFDSVGAVDGYSLYTGEQADGHNSGWIIYSPAGTGKIKFKVYGFRFGDPARQPTANKGFIRYEGGIGFRGTLLPGSLVFIEKHARSGTAQWRTKEGLTCNARIHKWNKSTQGGITANVFVAGGVDQVECVETPQGPLPAPSGNSGTNGPSPSSLSSAIQSGNTFQNTLAGNTANQAGPGSPQSGKGNLQNVTVSQKNVILTFWDHGKEDGDIITLYLNGKVLKENLVLTNKKQSFPVTLTSGSNLFEVEAKNEGSVPPNTASVRISNVTKGRGTQIYERKNGEKASMNLYAP